ncbi:MAG: ribbon-helix-helix domain-containing protein [Bryobacteraceae bacterium]
MVILSTPLSVTFPPEMLKRAKKIAAKENRTMSELIREAFREYTNLGALVKPDQGVRRGRGRPPHKTSQAARHLIYY